MPLYEHTFLARQDLATTQVDALIKEFTGVIEEGQGKITKQEYWGLKGLAFKIKKNRKAHFAFFNIDAPPAAVQEMERRMGLSTDVLRFLTVKVETLETEPSAQMRKQDRDERGDRGDRGDRGFGGGGGRGFGGGGREGGSTFRPRPPRDGDAPRGPRPPRDGDAPRGPRPQRDGDAPRGGGSTSGSEG